MDDPCDVVHVNPVAFLFAERIPQLDDPVYYQYVDEEPVAVILVLVYGDVQLPAIHNAAGYPVDPVLDRVVVVGMTLLCRQWTVVHEHGVEVRGHEETPVHLRLDDAP